MMMVMMMTMNDDDDDEEDEDDDQIVHGQTFSHDDIIKGAISKSCQNNI